jgi:hypothetical protein
MIPFRVSAEPVKWQEYAILVTEHSIAAAISWIEKMTFEPKPVREVSGLDALLEAGKDKTVSVYPWLAQVTKVASSLTVYSLCLHDTGPGLLLVALQGNWSIIIESTCLSFLSSCYGNIP